MSWVNNAIKTKFFEQDKSLKEANEYSMQWWTQKAKEKDMKNIKISF